MPNDAPLRGADPVNDGELEVGFDEKFEDRFFWLAIAGRAVLVAVVLLALSGLLGQGPFSHARAESASGRASVDFEPIARFGTTTQVTIHVTPQPGEQKAVVDISSSFIEPMGLQRVKPQPSSEQSDGGNQRLTFAVAPGDGSGGTQDLIRFMLKPSQIGPLDLQAVVNGTDTLHWTQWVLP